MNKQTTTCMEDYDPSALLIDAAIEKILDQVTPVQQCENIAIADALQRITSEAVSAPINVPSFTSSAMDGYAICHADLGSGRTAFKLIGTSLAGHPFSLLVKTGECVRITTGAVLPEGTDSVIMQEHASVEGHKVIFSGQSKYKQFARMPGSDTRQGDILLTANKRLAPADIALLASQGITHVMVRKKPRIAIISTGDELVQAGTPLKPGQIYDSNRALLSSMIQQLGLTCIDMGSVGDSPEALEQVFSHAAENVDAIISSGGVSVGEADFVKQLLEQFGELKFWKIAMKPGKPLTVGYYKSVPFFGLPGNPVSVCVTFTQLVRPAMEKMCGLAPKKQPTLLATTTTKLSKQAGRFEFQRGVLSKTEEGKWQVATTGAQDSHLLNSLGKANCYIMLPLASKGSEVGETVDVQFFSDAFL